MSVLPVTIIFQRAKPRYFIDGIFHRVPVVSQLTLTRINMLKRRVDGTAIGAKLKSSFHSLRGPYRTHELAPRKERSATCSSPCSLGRWWAKIRGRIMFFRSRDTDGKGIQNSVYVYRIFDADEYYFVPRRSSIDLCTFSMNFENRTLSYRIPCSISEYFYLFRFVFRFPFVVRILTYLSVFVDG